MKVNIKITIFIIYFSLQIINILAKIHEKHHHNGLQKNDTKISVKLTNVTKSNSSLTKVNHSIKKSNTKLKKSRPNNDKKEKKPNTKAAIKKTDIFSHQNKIYSNNTKDDIEEISISPTAKLVVHHGNQEKESNETKNFIEQVKQIANKTLQNSTNQFKNTTKLSATPESPFSKIKELLKLKKRQGNSSNITATVDKKLKTLNISEDGKATAENILTNPSGDNKTFVDGLPNLDKLKIKNYIHLQTRGHCAGSYCLNNSLGGSKLMTNNSKVPIKQFVKKNIDNASLIKAKLQENAQHKVNKTEIEINEKESKSNEYKAITDLLKLEKQQQAEVMHVSKKEDNNETTKKNNSITAREPLKEIKESSEEVINFDRGEDDLSNKTENNLPNTTGNVHGNNSQSVETDNFQYHNKSENSSVDDACTDAACLANPSPNDEAKIPTGNEEALDIKDGKNKNDTENIPNAKAVFTNVGLLQSRNYSNTVANNTNEKKINITEANQNKPDKECTDDACMAIFRKSLPKRENSHHKKSLEKPAIKTLCTEAGCLSIKDSENTTSHFNNKTNTLLGLLKNIVKEKNSKRRPNGTTYGFNTTSGAVPILMKMNKSKDILKHLHDDLGKDFHVQHFSKKNQDPTTKLKKYEKKKTHERKNFQPTQNNPNIYHKKMPNITCITSPCTAEIINKHIGSSFTKNRTIVSNSMLNKTTPINSVNETSVTKSNKTSESDHLINYDNEEDLMTEILNNSVSPNKDKKPNEKTETPVEFLSEVLRRNIQKRSKELLSNIQKEEGYKNPIGVKKRHAEYKFYAPTPARFIHLSKQREKIANHHRNKKLINDI